MADRAYRLLLTDPMILRLFEITRQCPGARGAAFTAHAWLQQQFQAHIQTDPGNASTVYIVFDCEESAVEFVLRYA